MRFGQFNYPNSFVLVRVGGYRCRRRFFPVVLVFSKSVHAAGAVLWVRSSLRLDDADISNRTAELPK